SEELGNSNLKLTELNKELQDANEELQASNEEMMLAQEELQATNEEFETTNEELEARGSELQELAEILTLQRVRLSEMIEHAPFSIGVVSGPSMIVEALNVPLGRFGSGLPLKGSSLEELAGPQLRPLVDGIREVYRTGV